MVESVGAESKTTTEQKESGTKRDGVMKPCLGQKSLTADTKVEKGGKEENDEDVDGEKKNKKDDLHPHPDDEDNHSEDEDSESEAGDEDSEEEHDHSEDEMLGDHVEESHFEVDYVCATKSKKKRKSSTLRKAPTAPKRFKTSYICFFTAKQAEIKEQLGDKASVSAISKRIAEMWKNLPQEERSHWDDMAAKDKQRYMEEKASYTGPWRIPSKPARKDPSAPKQPMSAFLYFAQEKRTQIKKENAEMKATQVSRILGEMWRNLTDEEREPHVEIARKERDKYNIVMAQWRKKNEHIQKAQRKAQAEQSERTANMPESFQPHIHPPPMSKDPDSQPGMSQEKTPAKRSGKTPEELEAELAKIRAERVVIKKEVNGVVKRHRRSKYMSVEEKKMAKRLQQRARRARKYHEQKDAARRSDNMTTCAEPFVILPEELEAERFVNACDMRSVHAVGAAKTPEETCGEGHAEAANMRATHDAKTQPEADPTANGGDMDSVCAVKSKEERWTQWRTKAASTRAARDEKTRLEKEAERIENAGKMRAVRAVKSPELEMEPCANAAKRPQEKTGTKCKYAVKRRIITI